MSEYDERMRRTKEDFSKWTTEHVITSLKEDGLLRTMTVQKPGTWVFGYTITTWPNYLAITGDLGSYVFTRSPDMFKFFREADGPKADNINPGYWEEKVCAADKHGTDEFCIENLRESILESQRDSPENPIYAKMLELETLDLCDSQDEHGTIEALMDIEDDPYERSHREFTYSFLNCLRAIVLAVRLYDERKTQPVKRISTEDEEAFKDRTAVGLATGSLRDTGDLRIVAVLADKTQVPLQFPQAWLNEEGGLAHFIRENCHPEKTVIEVGGSKEN